MHYTGKVKELNPFHVPETRKGGFDTSDSWFKQAAQFVTLACTAAYSPQPHEDFQADTDMVGRKMRALGREYDHNFDKCQDALEAAYHCAHGKFTPEEQHLRMSEEQYCRMSASLARKHLANERNSRLRSYLLLEKIAAIEDDAERGKAFQRHISLAHPMIIETGSKSSAEQYQAPDDDELIVKIFRGATEKNRVQLLLSLAKELQKSKVLEEKNFGILVCNTTKCVEDLQKHGLPDIVTRFVKIFSTTPEKVLPWQLMPWCIDDWLLRMEAKSSHGYNANPNKIWRNFSESLFNLLDGARGNPWQLLCGGRHKVRV